MGNIKKHRVIYSTLISFVFLLLISNLYFYRENRKLEKNSNYVFNISRAITIAGNENSMEMLTPKLVISDVDYLINKFKEIKPKIGRTYDMKNYITIKYENGNTLMVKVTRNKEGKFLIQDMFLLDKDIYEKIENDMNFSNLWKPSKGLIFD